MEETKIQYALKHKGLFEALIVLRINGHEQMFFFSTSEKEPTCKSTPGSSPTTSFTERKRSESCSEKKAIAQSILSKRKNMSMQKRDR